MGLTADQLSVELRRIEQLLDIRLKRIERRMSDEPKPDEKVTRTLMHELVETRVGSALIGQFSRTIDRVVEEVVMEVLKDQALRNDLQELIKAALRKTVQDLQLPSDPDSKRRRYGI